MSNDLISVPRTDLLMAMDELRQSGRDYPADLLKKALFSAPVGAEPVGLSLEVRTLGSYGKAFDLPGNRRAYTYDHQPGNIEAYRLGNACQQAAAASAGDTIDRGLGLLKELQAQGFGVFDAGSSRWHAAPVADPVSAEPTGEVVLFGGDSDLKEVSWRNGKMPPPGTKIYTAPVAAQAKPDPRTPADMKVNGGALKLALNALRRAGKNEIADELEKTATPAQQPVSGADGLPIELRGIAEAIGNGGGFWRSCSGCHESNEGMATGPFSETLKCHLGVGCSECGGIGAIWDTTDYDAMGDFMATEYQQRTVNTEPVGQDQLRDAMQIIEPSGNTGELPELPDIAPTDDWDSVLDCIKKYGVACYQAALQNQPQNIPEIIPESAKLDADKVQADLLNSLVEIVDAVIASDEEGLIEHSETIIKARAAIDAARKEQA